MDPNSEHWRDSKKFYLKIFSAIDEDVNGYLSDKEFKKFLISCDIQVIFLVPMLSFFCYQPNPCA